jgi:hypothetical protein
MELNYSLKRKSGYILFFCFYNETNSRFQFHFWVHAGTNTKTIIYLFSNSIFKFCQGVKTCCVSGVCQFQMAGIITMHAQFDILLYLQAHVHRWSKYNKGETSRL